MQTTGSVLSDSRLFRLFKRLLAGKCYLVFMKEYVCAKEGDTILDIGCGLGDVLEYLPRVDYYGFDMGSRYIEYARKRFGDRGKFMCRKVGEETMREGASYDIVLANCVLRHLNDGETVELSRFAHGGLKTGGRLFTIDSCYVKDQSVIERYLFSSNRGHFTRTKEQYLDLASRVFTGIKADIRHDLLRIPYTHIIMECTK